MSGTQPNWHPLPVFHLKAPHGWLNDPCGPGFDARTGQYHLFYQWNPTSCDWGDITWGHYISRDGLHWAANSSSPIIKPDAPYDKEGVFTGCLYSAGPSGEADQLTVIYSSVSYLPIHWSKPYMRNCAGLAAATSKDGGLTWRKVDANPILAGEPEGLVVTGFRDPYLAAWPAMDEARGSREAGLYGVVSGGIKGEGPAVFLYSVEQENLTAWKYLGPLIVAPPRVSLSGRWGGDFGVNWECANFMTLEDGQGHYGQFLTVGSEGAIAQEALEEREASYRGWCMWIVGSLKAVDGNISMDIECSGLLDHGCFYAPSSYKHLETGARIVWGWLKEEEVTLARREAKEWTGYLSMPRELFLLRIPWVIGTLKSPLKSVRSVQVFPDGDGATGTVQTLGIRPLPAQEKLRQGAPRVWHDVSFGGGSGTLPLTTSLAWELEAIVSVDGGHSPRVGFHFHHDENMSQRATLFFDPREEEIVLDLSSSNTEHDIEKPIMRGAFTLFQQRGPDGVKSLEKLRLRIFGDGDVVEIFANDRFALSAMAYADVNQCAGISCFVGEGSGEARFESVKLWEGLDNVLQSDKVPLAK